MDTHDPDQKVVKIDLTAAGRRKAQHSASTVLGRQTAAAAPTVGGMTMAQLKSNYEGILQAQAIFYPVVYQFLRELGRGRQGIVYLGLRQGARGCITEHAIKVFDPGLYRTPEEYWTDMGRIASQISRLQSIQSPNLVARHSYEETYGIGYAEMEAIDGIDLRHFMTRLHFSVARGRSTVEEWERFGRVIFGVDENEIYLQPGLVVYILRRVIRGIERLHAMNFLHCDIKPANIMIDRLGVVRIVDFGRAVMAGESVSFLFGSPLYMAPETHRRQPGRPQTDFYSVGLVAIEMLSGKPLTDLDEVEEEELLRIKEELPHRLPDMLPREVRKRRSLVRILRRLIEPDPANRYGSAKEADVGDEGLIVVDKQFTKESGVTDRGRVLSEYLSKLVDDRTGRIELGNVLNAGPSSKVII